MIIMLSLIMIAICVIILRQSNSVESLLLILTALNLTDVLIRISN